MNADNLQFLATVLTNLNDGSANWQEIATQRAITRKDNAMSSFKNMIKKVGLEYDGKKFKAIVGFDSANIQAATATSKVTTPRKRKVDGNSVNSPATKRQATKKSKAKINIKDEEDSENESSVVQSENEIQDGVGNTSDD